MRVNKRVIKRLFEYLKPYMGRLILSLISMVIVGALTGLVAYLIKPTLNQIFISRNKEMLILLPFAIIATYFFKGLFTYIQTYQTFYIAEKILFGIRNQLFDHLLRLSLDFHDRFHSGELLSRILNDSQQMQNSIAKIIPQTVRQFFTIIFLLMVIYINNVKLALIATVVFPIAIYPIISFGKKMKALGKRRQVSIAGITTKIQEALVNVRLIKAFVTEDREARDFEKINDEFLNINLASIKISEITSPLMEFIGALAIAFLIWFGGVLVFKHVITVGGFFSFMAALLMLYQPVKTLAKSNNEINSSVASIERIFYILDQSPSVENTGWIPFTGVRHGIEFNHVYFSYGEKQVLEDINLAIEAKTIVALVGESGGGKSTLLDLIPRFYDVTSGEITIDGINVKEFDLRTLRRRIAIVAQQVLLFNDTVRNNIAYGKENLSMEEIVRAAKLAYAHDFIMKLKDGYDTNLGEQGVILSGGEKQRIAIARAIVKNPDILILDEATSALDSEAEEIVQKALGNLMRNRTVIMAAHRISTAMVAHKIVAMKQGRIVDVGTHDELMRRCDYYKKLYDIQFKNDNLV